MRRGSDAILNMQIILITNVVELIDRDPSFAAESQLVGNVICV